MLPIQSLHLHRISPELGSGLACWKTSEAFPDFEQIDCVVSGRNPQFVLGILCSILLSYADTPAFYTESRLYRQGAEARGREGRAGKYTPA